ncbi:group III truncated hemoglobin [Xanthovirga aplysinae]|uniref:group III truncated hemoglobin n=1 Tax=Xanthovirga aplysinae TaxID=2529853 RepID=UPI0012BC187F|nr:group III truncated hemoglobin [Xanthovirga aplysinae]MTI32190.1 group III truncated hemoglobin [Xanthovirga aplysinae]
MVEERKDIETEEDIKKLVDSFYDKVKRDEILAPIFNETAQVNWEKHLPKMYTFWSSLLLGSATYRGNAFAKHAPLPIKEQHFTRWLQLFHKTIDDLFSGPKAAEAKHRSRMIGGVFLHKIERLNLLSQN